MVVFMGKFGYTLDVYVFAYVTRMLYVTELFLSRGPAIPYNLLTAQKTCANFVHIIQMLLNAYPNTLIGGT